MRRVKVGIDVGGTFTHAVAIDAATHEVVGAAMVPTTHTAEHGVARGVVLSMQRLLEEARIAPEEVALIAHSTTQATNALLEGDVAAVGILGMGRGFEGWRARSQTRVEDLELAPGKLLRTFHQFLDTSRRPADDRLLQAIEALRERGAEVLVASEAFGVDDPANELRAAELARGRGLLATAASDISRLYGLKVRTRTAVINASMLPRMLETADRTEEAVRAAGIRAPLMVMRSDGGIMDVQEMRRRPILTMLSGPAAGVAAALMHVRISDGLFLEVGGTSTDVSVVRHGRPTVRSGEVGGHRLYVRTLDIRTVGIGGGSMVRADDRSVRDVGPRSAHIAGLGYPSFAPPPQAALELLRIAPRPGDPGDYLAIRVAGEDRPSLALTATEAARALDSTSTAPDAAAAARVVDWIAGRLGTTSGELARTVLRLASAKVAAVVERLVADYGLERRHLVLVGGGGGAGAIVPFTAQALGLRHRIAERAEVISAIGAALGMIQDSVERNVVNPTADDLLGLRRAAVDSVVRMGAAPDSVDVKLEVDPRQKTITATARGTPDLRTKAPATLRLGRAELEAIAARDFEAGTTGIAGVGEAGLLCVYSGRAEQRRLFGLLRATLHPARVIDREGVVRLRLSDARADSGLLPALLARLPESLDELTAYGDAGGLLPDVFFIVAGRVVDLSGLATREQVLSVLRTETEHLGRDEPAVALLSRRQA